MKKHLRVLALFGALGVLAVAATVTVATLPDVGAGVFTQPNHDTINTNFTAVAAALNLMIPTSSLADCATTAACPSTAATALHVVIGRGTLATGSPSTDAITTISPAFTSATTYSCVAQDSTTIANNIGVLSAGYVSGSAVTFTGPNTNTDGFRFTCIGY